MSTVILNLFEDFSFNFFKILACSLLKPQSIELFDHVVTNYQAEPNSSRANSDFKLEFVDFSNCTWIFFQFEKWQYEYWGTSNQEENIAFTKRIHGWSTIISSSSIICGTLSILNAELNYLQLFYVLKDEKC